MSDLETLKAEIKKLSAKATQAKMNLHDLSEELPLQWQTIPAVAQQAYDAYAELEQKRAALKSLELARVRRQSTMTNATRDGRDWQPAYLLAIDEKKCIGCGRCFKVCGRSVMTLKGLSEEGELVDLDDDEDEEIEKKIMVMNDDGACIGCGACARVCPTNCQTHGSAPAAAG